MLLVETATEKWCIVSMRIIDHIIRRFISMMKSALERWIADQQASYAQRQPEESGKGMAT
jgi:hypothetical protein